MLCLACVIGWSVILGARAWLFAWLPMKETVGKFYTTLLRDSVLNYLEDFSGSKVYLSFQIDEKFNVL